MDDARAGAGEQDAGAAGERSPQRAANRAAASRTAAIRALLFVVAGCLALGAGLVGLHLWTRPSLPELAARVMKGDHAAGNQLLTRHRSGWLGVAEEQAAPYGELFGFGQAVTLPSGARQDPKPGTATGWPFSGGLGGRPVVVRPYRVLGGGKSRAAFMAYVFDADGGLVSAELHLVPPPAAWEMAEFRIADEFLHTYPPRGPTYALRGDRLVAVGQPDRGR